MQEDSIKKLTLTPRAIEKLKRLQRPPVQLYGLSSGMLDQLLDKPIVAVVGTRKMTPYGRYITEKISSELARLGVVIASGNAFGVDVTAQRAALDAKGSVIIVLPSDLRHIYPASNAAIAKRAVENGGLLISEHENNPTPRADEFLARNRLIAAPSDAVFIPEAAERSGSLNTASHAMKMNIPIFAAPGPLNSTQSAGTNKLIRKGFATLLTSAQDVITTLDIQPNGKLTTLAGRSGVEMSVLRAITDGIHDQTELQHRSKLATNELQTTLTMLEIEGLLRQDANGQWHTH